MNSIKVHLYNENFKILKKEIEDDPRRWRDHPCSQSGRLNIVTMSIRPKIIHRFNASAIKIPMQFFTELENNLKIHMETQNVLDNPKSLNNRNPAEGIIIYRAPVIKIA